MEFIVGEYILKIQNHDNGIICIIYNENYENDENVKIFGLDKFENKVYILNNFCWVYLKHYSNTKDLIDKVKIYIKKITKIDLSKTVTDLLIKICNDLLNGNDLDWMPIGDYYEFNGDTLITR